MQKIFFLFIFIVFMGCSSTMTRKGYHLQGLSINKDAQCNIPIKRNFPYNKNDVEILGTIRAGDSGI
jgi:hypothetical protein